ncbi:MAG: hypothetical protein N2C12_13760, partial [Planctomycetales bacterium]
MGIGRALRARGHQVTVIANPYYADYVEAENLDFIELGTREDLTEFWASSSIWHPAQFWKIALRYSAVQPMRQSYEIIRRLYEPGHTVVAGPGWAFGARIAQEKIGVPLATIHLESYLLRSIYRSPKMPPPLQLQDWVPKISKRFQLWIADRFFTDPCIADDTNSFRAQLGLPPVRRLLDQWWNSPQLVIGMFPEWFYSPQPDWPAKTELTGFPLSDGSSQQQPPNELVAFMSEGDPPIVFTAGSANEHAHRYFKTAVDTCHLLNRRGVLIASNRCQ